MTAPRRLPKVFISDVMPEPILAPLRNEAEVSVWTHIRQPSRVDLLTELQTCIGWLSMLTDQIDAELLAALPALRVIAQMAVGVDNVDLESCKRLSVHVAHTPDILTDTTADTAFALMAAAVRRIPEGEAMVKAGHWGPWRPWHFLSADLHGSTLGIVGMGRIGRAIARRAQGFDMNVLFASLTQKHVIGAEQVEFEHLLRSSDQIVVAVPLTDKTRGLFGTPEFKRMRNTACLVNIARGAIVDTTALLHALVNGSIASAALDVTDPEPLPADHPLLELPNCLVVPHIGSATIQARQAMARLAVANLVAFLRGEPMPSRVG